MSSDALLRSGPLVICFLLGSWSPPCNLEARYLQVSLAQIEQHGARLIAITPELSDNALALVESHHITFPVLSDVGNQVARRFGLVFALPQEARGFYSHFGFHIPSHNGDASWELPFPATYVADPSGTIVEAFVKPDLWQRMEPAEIVSVLAGLEASGAARRERDT